MAYDEELAARVRAVLRGEPGLTERAMFGGLGFMLDGHMAVAVGSSGEGLILRADPAVPSDLLGEHVRPMEMGGQGPMKGWLAVDSVRVADDESLSDVVGRGVAFVRTLPPK